jgi:hypothetical protein
LNEKAVQNIPFSKDYLSVAKSDRIYSAKNFNEFEYGSRESEL